MILKKLFSLGRQLKRYEIIARVQNGDFMSRHIVEAVDAYQACRKFDTSPDYQQYIRVSGATIFNS